jgi:chromosome partitioning protein
MGLKSANLTWPRWATRLDDGSEPAASGQLSRDAPAWARPAAAGPREGGFAVAGEPGDGGPTVAGGPTAPPAGGPTAPPAGGATGDDVRDDSSEASVAAPTRSPVRQWPTAAVIAIANQKGGVGKTTTAVSVAAAIAESGPKVLLVDLDPQGNASSGVGLRPREDQPTIYDVLIEELDLIDAIRPANVRNLFLVPANIDLAGAELELVSAFSREQRLRRALESVRDDYDLIVIDCPPSLGLLTVNALTAADGLLVPIQCEYYALEGLGALRRNADLIRANLNPRLEITGFVLTMLDGRTRLSHQVVEEVRAHFGDKVFSTRIPRTVRLAEAPGFGEPITVFDPGSRGAMAYRRLAREVVERLDAAATRHTRIQEGVSI